MWTPRKGSTLTMDVNERDGKHVYSFSPRLEAVVRILTACGFPSKDNAGVTVKWPARKLIAASDELDRMLSNDGFRPRWFLREPPAAANENSWYRILVGGAEPDTPRQMRSDVHFGSVQFDDKSYYHRAFVASQQFVEIVTAHGLNGIECLHAPPDGKKRQDGWWEVFATQFLGRAIDHPAFDSLHVDKMFTSINASSMMQRCGRGETYGGPSDVDPSRIADPWLAELAKKQLLRIRSHSRYIHEHLPKKVDFAYSSIPLGEESGTGMFDRDIVCSHKAKEILVAAGMLRPTHLDVIEVIPAAEADQPILDRTVKHPLPRAMLRPEDVEKERARRQALIDALPVPVVKRPGRTLTLRQAAERLGALWEKPRGRWGESGPVGTKTAEAKKIAKSAKVPIAWKEIAPLLPLIVEDPESTDMDLWRAAEPEVSGWAFEDAEQSDDAESPTKKDIEIGSTIFGDWYSVRLTDKAMPKDAKVRRWDHETGSIKQEWDNVAAFVQYLIETMEAVSKTPAE